MNWKNNSEAETIIKQIKSTERREIPMEPIAMPRMSKATV